MASKKTKTKHFGRTALSASEVSANIGAKVLASVDIETLDESEQPAGTEASRVETTPENTPPALSQKRRFQVAHPVWIATTTFLALLCVGALSWSAYMVANVGSLSSYAAGGVPINKSVPRETTEKELKKLSAYAFTVKNDGEKPKSFKGSDAGIEIDAKKTIATVLQKQSSSLLLDKLAFWKHHDEPLILSVDEGKLADFIKANLVRTTVEPKNATLSTETGEILTGDAINGEGVTVKNPRQTLLNAVEKQTPRLTITLTKQPIPANVQNADLQPLIDDIVTYSKLPVSLTIDGQAFTAPASTIISWVDAVQEGDVKAHLEVNSGKVKAWLDGIAKRFIIKTRNELRIQNEDGTSRILTAGRSGTEIEDSTQTAKDIARSVAAKQPVEKALGIVSKPYRIINVALYDKWLIADLSNHMLYAYEKDQLVNSFPMSAGAPETPTVVGEFKIYKKVRVQTMRGPNTDGTSYNVPNVEWVSYFYTDYAIHGNYWRPLSVFGTQNTSHGCIGMVNANSQWVYEWAPIGTPVITYN